MSEALFGHPVLEKNLEQREMESKIPAHGYAIENIENFLKNFAGEDFENVSETLIEL